MKKLLSISLACLLLFALLGACDKSPAVNPTPTRSVDNPTGDVPPDTGDDKSPITFTMFENTLRDKIKKDGFTSDSAMKIKDDTGVTFLNQFAVGEATTQISLMIANKDYPDFVFVGRDGSKFLDAGVIVDMDPYIQQYGPNILKLYGKYYDNLKDSEGHVYYLPPDGVNQFVGDPGGTCFVLQHAVVKELGYPRVRTLDDYYNAVKTYKQNNPTIDGQPSIGITLTCGDGFRWKITLGNPSATVNGLPDDGDYYVDPVTLETVYRFTLDNHKAYYKWLNQIYDEGILDKDSFTQSHEEYIAKIASGRVIGLTDAKWEYEWDAEATLTTEGKEDRCYARFNVTMDESIVSAANRAPIFAPEGGVMMTDNCSDPVRAIKFFDYLCREDMLVWRGWGWEGTDWEIVDGERQKTEEAIELGKDEEYGIKHGVGHFNYPFPSIGGGVMDKDGYSIATTTDREVIRNYKDIAKEVLAAYGAKMWRDFFPGSAEIPASSWGSAYTLIDNLPDGEPLKDTNQKLSDLTSLYLAKVSSCKPADFEKTWQEYQDKLAANGAGEAGARLTELVKEKSAKLAVNS